MKNDALIFAVTVVFALLLTIVPSVKPSAASSVPNSLCAANEQIVFSCTVKQHAKIVSLCSSKDLTKDSGYLQYRFGLPGKVELEFPKDRHGTQQQFRYMHYFRAQVDETEISFSLSGYTYTVFDSYNGEERPPISDAGVRVTAPGKPNDVSLVCRSRPKVFYEAVSEALPNDQRLAQ